MTRCCKGNYCWHWHVLLCAGLNTLLLTGTVVMIFLARPYIGERHEICAFGCSALHTINGDYEGVLVSDKNRDADEYILIDSSTNIVLSVTKDRVSLEWLEKMDHLGNVNEKRRLFCFAHESLSDESLIAVFSMFCDRLKRSEIYMAGVSSLCWKSLWPAIVGKCPLGIMCVEDRLRCVLWNERCKGVGKIKKLVIVWPISYKIDTIY